MTLKKFRCKQVLGESLSTFWHAACLNGLVSSIFLSNLFWLCWSGSESRVIHSVQIPLRKCIHHQWFMDHWIVTEDLFTLGCIAYPWVTLQWNIFNRLWRRICCLGLSEFLHCTSDGQRGPRKYDGNHRFADGTQIRSWNGIEMVGNEIKRSCIECTQ